MVPGALGLSGLHVPKAVVEEQRTGGDTVTVQPRPTVVETVRVITLMRDSVTLTFVTQVNYYSLQLTYLDAVTSHNLVQ